jgi:phage terminase large subunit
VTLPPAPAATAVEFPYTPRGYQLPFLRTMAGGCKRAALVWHRRAGKDITVWNWLITAALQRVGVYYYFGPTYAQVKKFLWDGLTNEGRPFLSYLPSDLVGARNETEMQMVLVNGSIIQLIGTENIDRVRGTNPLGVVFSEYSVGSPAAWPVIEPALLANNGWAVFVFTPKGKNHAYDLWQAAQAAPQRWHASLLTVNDTADEDGRPIVSADQIAQIRAEGLIDEETIQQEYFCSFAGSLRGAYYARQLDDAQAQNRITEVPHNPARPVITGWDLGIGDATAIWFVQPMPGGAYRVIDYLEAQGEALPFYAAEIRRRRYIYQVHLLPHDAGQRGIESGRTRADVLRGLGVRPIRVLEKLPVDDGIQAVRALLPMCQIDAAACAGGLDSLRQYRKEWDEAMQEFKRTPRHDKWSHGADAFRTLAMGLRTPIDGVTGVQTYAESAFNPLTWEETRPHSGRTQVRAETDYEVFS